MKVKKLTIRGLRGIQGPLEIPFMRDGRYVGCTVFGRNGAGKSSIADAWEWFQTGKIEHLSREGAGKETYRNRFMPKKEAESWVELELVHPTRTVRVCWDEGNTSPEFEAFGARFVRPCQIRYSDLKTFVLETKSKKFGVLAGLMGLEEQCAYQKELEKAQRKFTKEVEHAERSANESLSHIEDLAGSSLDEMPEAIRALFLAAGVDNDRSIHASEVADAIKRTNLEDRATEIDRMRRAQVVLDSAVTSCTELGRKVPDFLVDARKFHEDQAAAAEALFLRLYETGRPLSGRTNPACPLCDQVAPNLDQHLAQKLDGLASLRTDRNALEERRTALLHLLNEARTHVHPCSIMTAEVASEAQALLALIDSVSSAIAVEVESLEVESLPETDEFRSCAERLITNAETEQTEIEARLGADGETVESAIRTLKEIGDGWQRYQRELTEAQHLSRRRDAFEKVVKHYASRNLEHLRTEFGRISDLVGRFFAILEEKTPGLDAAQLVLDDKGSAARLSVEVYGETHSPAYRTLSESQLNSFGLAVQLAIAKTYNHDFKFLILDDVINSFDAHKRPRVVSLLREEFDEWQILLLTHDDLWRERLQRTLRHWNHDELVANPPPAIGARFKPPHKVVNRIEAVREKLENDRPHEAGALLGPYVEAQLQLICESFAAEVRFSRRQNPTLADLTRALRKRAVAKLGKSHLLISVLNSFEELSFFRNWTAHEKNPIAPFSPDEVQDALDAWLAVEDATCCSACNGPAKYDGKKRFLCDCETLVLQKE